MDGNRVHPGWVERHRPAEKDMMLSGCLEWKGTGAVQEFVYNGGIGLCRCNVGQVSIPVRFRLRRRTLLGTLPP